TQGRCLSADGKGRARRRFDSGERNFLKVSAVWISRAQSDLLELVADVFDRKFFAFRSRGAAFEFIRGQHFDMGEQSIRCDRIQRRLEPFRFRIISESGGEKSQGNEANEEFHVSSSSSSVTAGRACATLGLVGSRERSRTLVIPSPAAAGSRIPVRYLKASATGSLDRARDDGLL